MRFPVSGSKWSNGRNEKVIYNFERADRVPFIYTSEPSLEFSDRIVNIYMTNVVDAYNRTYENQRLMFSWRREPFSISEWVELSLSIWAFLKDCYDLDLVTIDKFGLYSALFCEMIESSL